MSNKHPISLNDIQEAAKRLKVYNSVRNKLSHKNFWEFED